MDSIIKVLMLGLDIGVYIFICCSDKEKWFYGFYGFIWNSILEFIFMIFLVRVLKV